MLNDYLDKYQQFDLVQQVLLQTVQADVVEEQKLDYLFRIDAFQQVIEAILDETEKLSTKTTLECFFYPQIRKKSVKIGLWGFFGGFFSPFH